MSLDRYQKTVTSLVYNPRTKSVGYVQDCIFYELNLCEDCGGGSSGVQEVFYKPTAPQLKSIPNELVTIDKAYIVTDTAPGLFYYDEDDFLTPDNGNTVIVNSDGKRFKRIVDLAILNTTEFNSSVTTVVNSALTIYLGSSDFTDVVNDQIAANLNVEVQDLAGEILFYAMKPPFVPEPTVYNYGISTPSADGTATSFSFAHGLSSTPLLINVNSGNALSKDFSYITRDASNITVHYTLAPSAGTLNFIWEARI